MSKKNNSPKLPRRNTECYQCQKRQVGCQSHCAAYLAFRAQRLEEAEQRKKEHKEDEDFVAVFANRQKDNRRKIRGKRR